MTHFSDFNSYASDTLRFQYYSSLCDDSAHLSDFNSSVGDTSIHFSSFNGSGRDASAQFSDFNNSAGDANDTFSIDQQGMVGNTSYNLSIIHLALLLYMGSIVCFK